ncbi:type VI secretion system accessory protein TagJ [Granulosicoccus antarcticus]|uniref:type VI secretion system accessory protein TagJ n=1 Tax=Granulosicoccus antarcticus TaxID=437505 RepID=UPI00146FA6A7|nr:type VI secretion system accessory protein TagJ [Granulosicoccus antarcticus]
MNVEECIDAGQLEAALEALRDGLSDEPANSEMQTLLFELLSVMGNWDLALNQLETAAGMNKGAFLMAQTYRKLLQCEVFRDEVFIGERAPLIFGEPDSWLATLIQSLQLAENGNGSLANERDMKAMEQAAPRSGTIDGQSFSWISDADMRLGPIFEIILDCKYCWVPFDNIAEISFSEPQCLRDLVWLPIQVRWVNKSSSAGFMPTRYPGLATVSDPQSALARKTDWTDIGERFYIGSGQRMFATENDEYPLLQAHKIVFETGFDPSLDTGSGQ